MAKIITIRNPEDLTSSFDQIQIERGSESDGSDMANITTVNIDTSTATDLTTGYTEHIDNTGEDTHYYRFRYYNSVSTAVSSYSDIFQADTTVMHIRFRKRMHDTNANKYYFSNDDISYILDNAIKKLYPNTWNEVIDESLTTLADTKKYSFPVGIFRVNDIEFIDAQGNVTLYPTKYKIRARQIIFDETPPTGYTFRLYADKKFNNLAETPEVLDDLILDLMALEAYQIFEADRSSYYKYTTITNPEGANLPSIRSIIERLVVSTKDRMNQLRRVRRPGKMKLA